MAARLTPEQKYARLQKEHKAYLVRGYKELASAQAAFQKMILFQAKAQVYLAKADVAFAESRLNQDDDPADNWEKQAVLKEAEAVVYKANAALHRLKNPALIIEDDETDNDAPAFDIAFDYLASLSERLAKIDNEEPSIEETNEEADDNDAPVFDIAFAKLKGLVEQSLLAEKDETDNDEPVFDIAFGYLLLRILNGGASIKEEYTDNDAPIFDVAFAHRTGDKTDNLVEEEAGEVKIHIVEFLPSGDEVSDDEVIIKSEQIPEARKRIYQCLENGVGTLNVFVKGKLFGRLKSFEGMEGVQVIRSEKPPKSAVTLEHDQIQHPLSFYLKRYQEAGNQQETEINLERAIRRESEQQFPNELLDAVFVGMHVEGDGLLRAILSVEGTDVNILYCLEMNAKGQTRIFKVGCPHNTERQSQLLVWLNTGQDPYFANQSKNDKVPKNDNVPKKILVQLAGELKSPLAEDPKANEFGKYTVTHLKKRNSGKEMGWYLIEVSGDQSVKFLGANSSQAKEALEQLILREQEMDLQKMASILYPECLVKFTEDGFCLKTADGTHQCLGNNFATAYQTLSDELFNNK